jgi:sporulation protein YlmC with PRC-barrel domain
MNQTMHTPTSKTTTAGHMASRVLSASTLNDDDVYNLEGEKLGSIKEIMLDIDTGNVAYAVLSFGGFLSLGEKLFAVPWHALTVDTDNHRLVMDVDEERLKNAPGFDDDHWPDMADPTWEQTVHAFYGAAGKLT